MPDDTLALTFHSRGELSREKYVGQFALCVGLRGMIAFHTVQVLKVDFSHLVGQRGDINHSGRRWMLQQIHKEERKKEMSWRRKGVIHHMSSVNNLHCF